MPKFIVWGFNYGASSREATMVAVCKTAEQAFEVIRSQMKEEILDNNMSVTRWFHISQENVPMPGFE